MECIISSANAKSFVYKTVIKPARTDATQKGIACNMPSFTRLFFILSKLRLRNNLNGEADDIGNWLNGQLLSE